MLLSENFFILCFVFRSLVCLELILWDDCEVCVLVCVFFLWVSKCSIC